MQPGLRRIFFVLCLLIAAPALALAQSNEQSNLNGWSAALNQVDASLRRNDLERADLVDLKSDVQAVLSSANALKQSLEPQIANANAQLQSLAPPATATPTAAPTAAESTAVTAERARQQAILANLVGLSQQSDAVAVRATQLIDAISDQANQRFNATLLARSDSIFSPVAWLAVANALPDVAARTGGIIAAWANLITARPIGQLALLAAGVLIVVVGLFVLRRFLRRWPIGRRQRTIAPSHGARIVTATAILLIDVFTPLLILLGLRALLRTNGLLPDSIGSLLAGLTVGVLIFSTLTGLARALLEPTQPAWRIAEVADTTARQVFRLVAIAAVLFLVMPLIRRIATVASAPDSFALTITSGLVVIVAVLVILMTSAISRGRLLLDHAVRQSSLRWTWLAPVVILAALVGLVAAAIGYLTLARFVIEQIVWVEVVLACLVLAFGLVGEATRTMLAGNGPAGLLLSRNFGFGERAVAQSAVLVDGLLRLLLVVLAVVLIAAPWGFSSDDVLSDVSGLLTGVRIGTITVTFSTIIAAIVVFIVGVVVARIFQAWLDKRFLPTTSMDVGLRDSISTGLGYIGIVLAGLLAFSYAGLNLSSVAILAGALSVGIGFGLQSIVNNFVSGLILLAERPIRAGDWIVVGQDEGLVRRIRVRATEIETFDRASVIIPNSSLISGPVKNVFFRDSTGRILINVAVSQDTDPVKVREILLDCASRHPLVLRHPEPAVVFADFAGNSLQFQLIGWVAEALKGGGVMSDLRFAILARLRDAGIAISRPQTDLNVRDWPRIEQSIRDLVAGAAGQFNPTTKGTQEAQ